MKLIIGVDEAGRGPLAGPVTVGVFSAPENFRQKLIKILGGKIKDSKQISPIKRYTIYRIFLKLRDEGKVSFSVSHISNKIIDRRGISYATNLGIKRCLRILELEIRNSLKIENFKLKIVLDGLLKAPENYTNQQTIIRGDATNIFIACASIVAKVSRDALMKKLAKKYPKYGFEIHKGYGTKLHRTNIKKFGLSEIHRKSFCRGLLLLRE